LFILAESDTGYVHSIIPYYGKITEVCNLPFPYKPFTTRIVISLMDHLVLSVSGIQGYHLFTNQYYSSVDLAKELDKRECYTTGTIIARRVGNSKLVRQVALKKMKCGDISGYRNVNILVMGWKDKRVVLIVSTYHDTSMEKFQKRGKQKEIQKPVCVLESSTHTGF
jgi:hypothetical protein